MPFSALARAGVRVSGDVSIPHPFAKDYVWSDIIFSSNALLYVKLPISEGVWMVSGWCLGVSGWSPSPPVILDAAYRVFMPKQVIKVQLV